jgi:hypothetical protein
MRDKSLEPLDMRHKTLEPLAYSRWRMVHLSYTSSHQNIQLMCLILISMPSIFLEISITNKGEREKERGGSEGGGERASERGRPRRICRGGGEAERETPEDLSRFASSLVSQKFKFTAASSA